MKSTIPRSQQKHTKTKTVKALEALAESKPAFPLMFKAAETGDFFWFQTLTLFGVSRPTVLFVLLQ